MRRNLTMYDLAKTEGRDEGRDEGRRLALRDVLKEDLEMKFESEGTRFFAQLPEDFESAKIAELRRAVLSASKTDDLLEWIR